ncbi:MAG: 5'-methylthioadenosine/adenosylhomocysteine nucleosidase [Lachnospiraceae bacterium]
MLGIIGAMDEEVAKIKNEMEDVTVTKKAGMDFYKGVISGHPVVVVRSGIGKVNAGMCTQILVDDYNIDAVINTGIAGSLNADINIGDIVLSTDTLEHDMDAVNFGYPLGQIPRMDTLSFGADENLRRIAKEVCKQVNPDVNVFEGRIVSGDQFISDKEKKNWLIDNFAGFCTEMEGAAIGHAAYLNKIPFLIIRAISDKADDSATMDYPTFEAKAIEHSVKLLLALCERLA